MYMGKKFLKLTKGRVTQYPMVKPVIIHEEFLKLSKRDATVSCVAHTRDVSAKARRIPKMELDHDHSHNVGAPSKALLTTKCP